MSYSLDDLAKDIRSALKKAPIAECAQEVCGYVARALKDENFLALNLPDRKEGEPPRQVLYEDPELGFCICGHVYHGEAIGNPHDHGPSWAIYGQAKGTTEMTDWTIVKQGSGEDPSLVEPAQTYTLKPGDAHFYNVGSVHSPKRTEPTRLIRIEGSNLDHITRSNIKAA